MERKVRAQLNSCLAVAIVILVFGQGCRDLGTSPPSQTVPPVITLIAPDSAAVGDTIQIVGSGFGSSQGTNVLIIGGQTIVTGIIAWGDTEIRAIVPAGAISTGVIVTANDLASNTKPYTIIGAVVPPGPVLASITPDSAEVGDLIAINGNNLGAAQGASILVIGTRTATRIVSWSETQIQAEVPLLAVTDSVTVTVNGKKSNTVPFRSSLISFNARVKPVLQSSCVGCHGGTAGLFVDSYAHLTAGTSTNGPVVTAGNGEGSYLIKKLRGTAPGARMPQGGPFLQDEIINKFSTWIQQGAANN